MRINTILSKVGLIVFIVGISMLVPMLVSLYYDESAWKSFLVSSLLTIIIGGGLTYFCKNTESIRHREGFAIVSFGWFFASLFGSIPYLLSGTFNKFSDALFETVSGFTTTGATAMIDIELASNGILFWRSLTQWLGGMGIVILFVALLSTMGSDAIKIFKAELPGPTFEKIRPRLNETARILWFTYVSLTVLLFFLLWLCGMSVFDAINHSFTTISTGGFSTKSASIGAFSNSFIHFIIIFFMFLGGINFSLYYQALKNRSLKNFWKNEEFVSYLAIILIVSIAVTINLHTSNNHFRFMDVIFQVTSLTSTGFSSVDYETWPAFTQVLLIFLMFIGASSSSTSGSIKVGRYIIMFKYVVAELKRLSHPRAVISVKLNNKVLSSDTVVAIYQFFFLYLMIAVAGVFFLGFLNIDLITAVSAVAASLSNVGPGLGAIGPTENFSHFSAAAKTILILLMLLGRLEIYTLLVLLLPNTWRK